MSSRFNSKVQAGATNIKIGWLWSVCLFACFAVELRAQSPKNVGPMIFPGSTDFYLQVLSPDHLIDDLWNHPVKAKIEMLEPIQQALKSEDMRSAKLGLAFWEGQVGESWLPALKKLTSEGLFVGLDADTQSFGLVFESSDEAFLKKSAGALLGMVKSFGGDDQFEISDYRNGKVAKFENLSIARFGSWFIVSNKTKFAKTIADNLLDGVIGEKQLTDTLAAGQVFSNAYQTIVGDRDAWTFLDLSKIRESGIAPDLFAGTTDNPAVELLLGGVLEAFEDADFLSAELELNDQQLTIKTALPFQSTDFRSQREFFFGNQALGRAPGLMEIPDAIGQIVAYRNFSGWWQSKEDLFPENVIAELAVVDSQLSTVFGGTDFGEDILGELHPGVRLIVKEQTYNDGIDPVVKVPAFALVGRLQNPDRARQFKVSFNSVIAILNLSDENNLPQFDVESFREDGYRITSANYYLEDIEDKTLLAYNFSPALAFQDDYIVISSSEQLAREIAEATKGLDEDSETSLSHSFVTIDAAKLKDILEMNRESMVAQSMLEGGKSREQSEAEIKIALELLESVEKSELDYHIQDQSMNLDFRLDFRSTQR